MGIQTIIAVCIIVNMKFKAKNMIATHKNLFVKEPTALNTGFSTLNLLNSSMTASVKMGMTMLAKRLEYTG